jgi:hypothetical protein
MPRISLPTLIRYLKKHYEELSALWSVIHNYEILGELSRMQKRIDALIRSLEELEASKKEGCLIE